MQAGRWAAKKVKRMMGTHSSFSYIADFCFVGWEVGREGFRPDLWAEVAGHADEGACKDESLCRTVEVAQIQRMGMVCLPSREEHGQHRDQRSKGANLGRAVSNSRRLEETGQSAVQRINPMVKKFSQRARGAGSARLLSVDVVHGGVHPHAKGEAVVYP